MMGFMFEALLLLPWGNTVYFNGDSYDVAADGLVIPNGVLFSADKKWGFTHAFKADVNRTQHKCSVSKRPYQFKKKKNN